MASKLTRISRVNAGRVVLIVSLVWFAATLLLFLYIDEKMSQRHLGYKHQPHEDFSGISGVFQKLNNMSFKNPSNRLAVLSEIVSLLETGANRTEEILKLLDAEVKRIYQANAEVLKRQENEANEKEVVLYQRIESLHDRLKNLLPGIDLQNEQNMDIKRQDIDQDRVRRLKTLNIK